MVDDYTLDVRLLERIARKTRSSGTGSTAASAVAVERGLVAPPVMLTPAGPLNLWWEEADILLSGKAEVVAAVSFSWKGNQIK